MAYRRKTRRGRKSRKRRAPRRLSKHMVRAIKAISAGPIETKCFKTDVSFGAYLSGATYVSGPQAGFRVNILSDIPIADNVGNKTEAEMIGNKMLLRGFKWQIHMYQYNATALAPDLQFRFTVYSDRAYGPGVTSLPPADRLFDQDLDTTATWSTWNPQTAKIHFQKRFRLSHTAQTTQLLDRKFYVKLRRQITKEGEESVVTNNYVGSVKGLQLYWALETFGPTIPDLTTAVTCKIGTSLYFKDP